MFNDAATTEIYTRSLVGSFRCVEETALGETLEKAGQDYRKRVRKSPRAVDYLKGRGVSGEIAQRYGLGYAPEGWRHLASVFAPVSYTHLRAHEPVLDLVCRLLIAKKKHKNNKKKNNNKTPNTYHVGELLHHILRDAESIGTEYG